jgi:hypothetical protein
MIPAPAGLTAKEVCEIRLKCIEPVIQTASKAGLEKDACTEIAEKVWEFVVKPLNEKANKPGK